MTETKTPLRWTGSAEYIASNDLQRIVNVSIALGRPLLLRGEPGTGKTLLARSISSGLGLPLLTWHVKSTTKAKEGCYVYDAVQRLYDSRFQDRDVSDIRQYTKPRVGLCSSSTRSTRRMSSSQTTCCMSSTR